MPNARPQPGPISLNRRVVFLHVAKTAGTSIVHFFRRRLPAGTVCSHGDFLAFPEPRAQFQRKLRQYRFVSGHFGYIDIAELLPDSYSFTFLRDPVDRVLSLYKFCMHADMQKQFAVARAARDLGLEGFLASDLPEVCEMLDNQQTWQFARMYWREDRRALAHLSGGQLLQMARSHLAQFSHVGLTETFDDDFAKILSDLGIEARVPHTRQFQTADPVTREQLSPLTLQCLRERLTLDYALLDFVRTRRLENGRADRLDER